MLQNLTEKLRVTACGYPMVKFARLNEVFSKFFQLGASQVESINVAKIRLVRQSQIVQSVMQDCKHVLSHLLHVSDLLVQGPKITYNNNITVCQDGFKIKCGVLR